ncbi:MAG: hypothetical protein ACKO37_00660 [Vampirovibrionales bacterium]
MALSRSAGVLFKNASLIEGCYSVIALLYRGGYQCFKSLHWGTLCVGLQCYRALRTSSQWFAFMAWWLLSTTLSAEAVSLIVGIPSADTTPKKQVWLTHESQLSPWKTGLGSDWKRRPDWNSFQFLTYGVSDRTELSFAASNIASKPEQTLHIAGGYKSYIPLLKKRFPKHDFRLIHGAMLPVSLRGKGLGYWAFTMASATLPRTKTRFTVGVSAGSAEVYGREVVVAMAGVEQKLGKHWALAVDWQSGRHDLGAVIPAVLYHFNASDVLIVGYKLPNYAENGKQAIVVEFTKRLK